MIIRPALLLVLMMVAVFTGCTPVSAIRLRREKDEEERTAKAPTEPSGDAVQAKQMVLRPLLRGFFKQTLSCTFRSGFSDPLIGDFRKTDTYCNDYTSCLRKSVCCAPQPPEQVISAIRFLHPIKTQRPLSRDPETDPLPLLNWRSSEERVRFARCFKVAFIVHGFIESWFESPWMIDMADGLLGRGYCVVSVDWSLGNRLNYFQSMANVRVVGAVVGYALDIWDVGSKSLLIGFSLGAHAVAEAAQFHFIATGSRIKECHGIDPAGPFFDGCPRDTRLSEDDCDIVQVIHSNAQTDETMPAVTGYGTNVKSGRCDYWINCGFSQEDTCPTATLATPMPLGANNISEFLIQEMCHHFRSPQMYVSSLKRRRSCASLSSFSVMECTNCASRCPPIHNSSMPSVRSVPFIFDNKCSRRMDYYVKTQETGGGEEGDPSPESPERNGCESRNV